LPGFETEFKSDIHSLYTDMTCAVCRIDFNDDEKLFSSHCFHLYHEACFTRYWGYGGGRCANCRTALPVNEEDWLS